ncbi:hypothetical protein [Laspinema olomoucense]|uniref:Uncharacterized protein n=1 Tax=Laspinema olomoucense D3b TaxID=2953688 RepID=A0ABT2N5V6_9CYAN|nr:MULTISPECIES: hypothetical protein [unclassified Laspinema]MCT7978070.1 hypothetical protein [Laspinema sp. D3b]MCT7988896.1 hypothetical protein [Laspinema sp. D3a]
MSRSPGVFVGVTALGAFGDFVMAIARPLQLYGTMPPVVFNPGNSSQLLSSSTTSGDFPLAIALPLGW